MTTCWTIQVSRKGWVSVMEVVVPEIIGNTVCLQKTRQVNACAKFCLKMCAN